MKTLWTLMILALLSVFLALPLAAQDNEYVFGKGISLGTTGGFTLVRLHATGDPLVPYKAESVLGGEYGVGVKFRDPAKPGSNPVAEVSFMVVCATPADGGGNFNFAFGPFATFLNSFQVGAAYYTGPRSIGVTSWDFYFSITPGIFPATKAMIQRIF